jgi:hypothetical protein
MSNTKIMHTAFANGIATFKVLTRLAVKGPEIRRELIAVVTGELAAADGTLPSDDLVRIVAASVAVAEDVGYLDRLRGGRLQVTEEGARMAQKFFACTQPSK